MRRPGVSTDNILVIIASLVIIAVMLYPVFDSTKRWGHHHPQNHCLSYQRQISFAMQIYTQEHADTMPPAKGWTTAIDVEPRMLRCDEADDLSIGYAYSSQVAGKKVKQFQHPDMVPVTYDARRGKPEYRHSGGLMLSFLDDHVQYLKKDKAQPLLALPPMRKD